MSDPADASRDHLSPAEFARRSGLSLSTIRRYVQAGVLPHVQPGGFRARILIPADALATLRPAPALAENPAPSVSDPPPTTPSPPSGPRPRWLRGTPRT